MRHQFARRITFALVLLLSVSLCFDQALAQRKRNKRSRRVTNPVVRPQVAPPATITPAEPQIISTADQQATDQGNASDTSGQAQTAPRRTNRKRPAATAAEPESDEDSMRRTVNDLTNQVTKLSEKLSQMESQQRTLVDLERLSRAEQRADGAERGR